MRKLAAALLLALSSGCISFDVEWERVEPASAVVQEGGFRLALPVGWARSGNFLTRDGGMLHGILFRALRDDERGLDAAREAPDVRGFRCTEFERDGLHLRHASFEASLTAVGCGLGDLATWFLRPLEAEGRYELVQIEAASGGALLLVYLAPPLYYFERDLPAFEALVASVELAAD